MKKLQLAVELCYDDEIYHGDDEDSIEWFNTDIIGKGDKGLALHSDEVGDRVGDITVLGSLAEIRRQERERCVKRLWAINEEYESNISLPDAIREFESSDSAAEAIDVIKGLK